MSFYSDVVKFKKEVKVGDVFVLHIDDIAIEYDGALPDTFDFTVIKKYPNVVLMERNSKKGVHRQSLDYKKLLLLINDENPNARATWIKSTFIDDKKVLYD